MMKYSMRGVVFVLELGSWVLRLRVFGASRACRKFYAPAAFPTPRMTFFVHSLFMSCRVVGCVRLTVP